MYESEGHAEQSYETGKAKRPGAIDDLDRELSQLDEVIERASAILRPISNQYGEATAQLSEPRPEPSSELRGRIERVRIARERLARILSEVDL